MSSAVGARKRPFRCEHLFLGLKTATLAALARAAEVARALDVSGFLSSRWKGEGCVRGLTGRVLRRFTLVAEGAWSEEHDAFHMDEAVTYADGRTAQRHWGVSYDGLGLWTGADDMGGRIRLRADGDGRLVLRFDRSRAVPAISTPSVRIVLRPRGADTLVGRGVTRVLGLPVARTELTYVRRDAGDR